MTGTLTDEQLRWVALFTGVVLEPVREVAAAFLGDSGEARANGPPVSADGERKPGAALPVITINPSSATLDPAEHQDFSATADYPDGTSALLSQVQWSASDPAITIDENGRATARPVSVTATITGTDPESGAQGTATVIVAPQPIAAPPSPNQPRQPAEKAVLTAIKVERAAGPDNVSSTSGGGHLQLVAIGTYSDKHSEDISRQVAWSSSNTDVSVRPNGLAITDKAPAEARITATDKYSGISGMADIEVPPADFDQVLLRVDVVPASGAIDGGGTLKFTATGSYADGSPRDLTHVVRWETSDPAISIDDKGSAVAQTVTLTGPVTITATDPDTGLAGTAELSIAPPKGSGVLLRIVLAPEDGTIDATGEVQFTASGVFDAGPPSDITGSVDWSSDNAAVTIDAKGKAIAQPQSATVTITATDPLSGLTGTTTLTIAPPKMRSVHTPFGDFFYWLHNEAAVKPPLEEASTAYLTVEPMEDEVTAAIRNLETAQAKVPDASAALGEIEQFTDRSTSGDAAEAAGAKILADSLKHDFEYLQSEFESIREDTQIDKDEVERAKDQKLKDEYKRKAEQVDEIASTVIESVKNEIKTALNPASAIDQIALALKVLAKKTNDWTKKSKELEEKADELGLKDAKRRYEAAIKRQEAMETYIAKKQDDLGAAGGHSQGKWEKAEYWYDTTADKNHNGTFRFYNLREAVRLAKLAAGLADPAHDAIGDALAAVRKLAKFGRLPEYWMADPAEDQKILKTWTETVLQMFEDSQQDLDFANRLLRENQKLFKDARDAMDHALGAGSKQAALPKDDVE